MKNSPLLIVEDDKSTNLHLVKMAEDLNCFNKIDSFTSSDEAYIYLLKLKSSNKLYQGIIILDIYMEGDMDGLELLDHIYEEDLIDINQSRIKILTAHNSMRIIEELEKYPLNIEFIVKPLGVRQMSQMVTSL